MYHESEGQKNQVSNQINDSDCKIEQNFNGKKPNPALQNRLPQFLHQLDRETMSLIQEYLEKNKQKNAKRKKTDRKISLYEDLTWITQFKKNEEALVSNKKSQTTQDILKALSGFRSIVTIKERVQKMLSKLTVQQIKHHIQRNEDFCFDSKKNLVVFHRLGEAKNQREQKQQRYYKKESNSNDIYQEDDLPEKVQQPKPTSYVRKELMEIEEKGKQSLQYKLGRLSVATDNFSMQPPKKTHGRVITNEKSKQDITQAIVCVFNLENKTIKCFRKMEETKPEKSQTIKTGEFLSQIKQTKDKYETTPVKCEGQQQIQQESNSSKKQATLSSGQTQKSAKKYAEVLEKNKQYQQTLGKMIQTSTNNEKNEIVQSEQFRDILIPNAGTMGSESLQNSSKNKSISKPQQAQKQNMQNNSNRESELQTLRYQLSNNEQYMKMVNQDPKLSNKYIFCKQEDQALIKFNECTHQQLLTIKCLLRYKNIELIEERLRFLNIPINEGFYAAVKQIIGQNANSNNY